jgi:hypothetical protein
MPSPFVISFPVLDDVRPWTLDCTGRAILLQMQPIAPVHIGKQAPTHCKVVAMLENGKITKITIPIKLWESKCRDPVFFVEGADVRGPVAALKGPSVPT